MTTIESWSELATSLPTSSTLLVGNGLSMSCDGCYAYGSLYEAALENDRTGRRPLKAEVRELFDHFETDNFEIVLARLEDAETVCRVHAIECKAIQASKQVVADALVNAVADQHIERSIRIRGEWSSALGELVECFGRVFTTNYDLLLYWHWEQLDLTDGFKWTPEGVHFEEYYKAESRSIYYLHGALFLTETGGVTRKLTSGGNGLTGVVRASLDGGRRPLIVSGGSAATKKVLIDQSRYLTHCFRTLERVGGTVATVGFGFEDVDSHLAEAVLRSAARELWIGVYEGTPGKVDRIENFLIRVGPAARPRIRFFETKGILPDPPTA